MSEMSSSDNPVAAEKTAQTRAAAEQRNGRGARYALFTMVVLAAAASGYFVWHSLQKNQQQLGADAASVRLQLDALAHRTEQLEQQVGEALPGNIRTLQTQQQSLEDSLAQLRSEVAGGSRIWDLEEIATLLQIANDRLHLEKEVAPSLAALEAADQHLRDLKNPALLEVRRLLAEEITALRSTANPDIAGTALTLGALIQGIDRLPIANTSFAEQPKSDTGTEQGWRGVLHDLWEKIKSLVVIQRHGGVDRPLLAPDERYFLRQNLRLNLEAARIALLRRDSQTYRQTLRSAAEWIALYFDNDAPATAGALQELTSLLQIDIAPSLPDISGSLNALQTLLDRQRQQKTSNAPRAHP